MVVEVKERKAVEKNTKPKFRDPSTLTEEQLTDPDYRLKEIMKHNGGQATCSKCHHCR